MNLRKASKLILGLSLKIVFWIVCLMVFILICSRAFDFGYQVFSGKGISAEGNGTQIEVDIPVGADATEVAEILLEEELIENKTIFKIQAFLYEAEFASGKYLLNTQDSGQDIIESLRPEEE